MRHKNEIELRLSAEDRVCGPFQKSHQGAIYGELTVSPRSDPVAL